MAKALERKLLQYILRLDEGISIKQYNKEIDEAVARVGAGEYYTHEEVERMAKEW